MYPHSGDAATGTVVFCYLLSAELSVFALFSNADMIFFEIGSNAAFIALFSICDLNSNSISIFTVLDFFDF